MKTLVKTVPVPWEPYQTFFKKKKKRPVCIFPMKNLSKDFENTLIYFNSKTLHTISPTDLYVFPENSWTKKKKKVLR